MEGALFDAYSQCRLRALSLVACLAFIGLILLLFGAAVCTAEVFGLRLPA